jgi:hypothetical protein
MIRSENSKSKKKLSGALKQNDTLAFLTGIMDFFLQWVSF